MLGPFHSAGFGRGVLKTVACAVRRMLPKRIERDISAVLTGVVKVVHVDRPDLVNGWLASVRATPEATELASLPGSVFATHDHRLRDVVL